MTQKQVAERIKSITSDLEYHGNLTSYAIQSITEGRSNYPVSNLLSYCKGMGLKLMMFDLTTEDCFYPSSVLEVHDVLNTLMKRYDVNCQLVYRKTAVHYTAPKSTDGEGAKKKSGKTEEGKYTAPLSIKTLLAVCEVIHCDLLFESN